MRAAFGRQPADFWPLPAARLAYGVLSSRPSAHPGERKLAAFSGHLPFVAGLSNLLFFALVVGRSEHRFLLPFGFFLSACGGIACDALFLRFPSALAKEVITATLGLGFAWAGLFELRRSPHAAR